MADRTWQVRLSVDDLNASIFLLETDAEVAAWARGLLRGLNAGSAKDGASPEYSAGWEIGSNARAKADAIRAGLAENGRAGGNAKASKCLADATAIATADATGNAVAVALAEPRTKNQEPRTKGTRELKTKLSAEAEEIYSLYPRKEARADAIKAIEKALRKTSVEVLADAVQAFAVAVKGQETRFIPHPATWFNGERWMDDRATWTAWKANTKPHEAPNLPEWKREKIAQLERDARRFESGGMGQSAKMIRREIADLMGVDNA